MTSQVAQVCSLLCNVQNIRICMGEKTNVSVAHECKRIFNKIRLTLLKRQQTGSNKTH